MKPSILFLIFSLAFTWINQLNAQTFTPVQDAAAFRQGLEAMAENTNTITTAFIQEKHMEILSKPMASEGKMQFKKPNLLRWEYTKPYEYSIILDGEKITINDQGKVNAMEIGASQAFRQINELIVNSVRGNVLDDERFTIEIEESEKLYHSILHPKDADMKRFLEKINIYFNKEDFAVSKIILWEAAADYTEIIFKDRKINEAIADDVFSGK